MWNLLKAELLKLRRCQILWVGLVALALCPLVQYGSQLIVEAEYRNPNYDFSTLFENVVWGNTQMFFPMKIGKQWARDWKQPEKSSKVSVWRE